MTRVDSYDGIDDFIPDSDLRKTAGATFLWFAVQGTFADVERELKRRSEHDQSYYGTDPYSGSWANIPRVRQVNVRGTYDERTARDYLSDHVEKWGDALALEWQKDEWIVAALAAE